MNKLTPLEKRLRRIEFWRGRGHEPTAPNCYWSQGEPLVTDDAHCDVCAELRRIMERN